MEMHAMRVLLAIGGSTNGIIHLAAIAGRMGLEIDLDALDQHENRPPFMTVQFVIYVGY